MFPITAIYAGLLALLLLTLSARVITYRRGHLISLGDNDHPALRTRMRAHGNCVENAPIGIILLALVEANGAPAVATHALGLMLLSGRVLHAFGFWGEHPTMRLRVSGMVLTLVMIALSAIGLLLHGIF